MTRLLVTGGTGYLGQRIVACAVQKGYDVRVLCRQKPVNDLFPASVEIAIGDLYDPVSLQNAITGCQAAIHSAGLVTPWEKDSALLMRTNVEGTENLLQAAFQNGVDRVVYTSSIFALGPTNGLPVDESWDRTSQLGDMPYAQSKAEALRIVRQWIKKGYNVVPVYPGIIYGPGEARDSNYMSRFIQDFSRRKLPGFIGGGENRFTLSFVDDVAKGHLLALENGRNGEGYILGGEDVTMQSFFEMLHEITGIPAPKRSLPGWLASIYALWEEGRLQWNPNYKPVLTRNLLLVFNKNWWFSSQKAIGELGYTRTPVKIGLIKTLESLGLAPPEDRSTIL